MFDENQAYKRSKDISIDSDDGDLPIFEEEEVQPDNPSTIQEEEEESSETIQPVVILKARKIPNWSKATLKDVEGHGVVKGTFRERKRLKRYSRYVAYMMRLIEIEPCTFVEASHK